MSSIEAVRAAGQDSPPARSTRAMVSLHYKPTIAVGELDETNTSGTIERVFLFPPASLEMGQMGTAHASHTSRARGESAISDKALACAWLAAARTLRAVLVWRDSGERLCAATPTPFERGCCCC